MAVKHLFTQAPGLASTWKVVSCDFDPVAKSLGLVIDFDFQNRLVEWAPVTKSEATKLLTTQEAARKWKTPERRFIEWCEKASWALVKNTLIGAGYLECGNLCKRNTKSFCFRLGSPLQDAEWALSSEEFWIPEDTRSKMEWLGIDKDRARIIIDEIAASAGFAQELSDGIEVGGLTTCRLRCDALPCMGRERAPHHVEQSFHPPLAAATIQVPRQIE